MMVQSLQEPVDGKKLTRMEQRILTLFENGRLSMEKALALTEDDQSRISSSISRLIGDGYVELVVLQYSWGVEFELRRLAN